MADSQMIDAIESLQNSQSNIKVFTTIPMGILMIVYFFSFATLIDRGMYGLLTFEIVTTVLFIAAIIFINPFSFMILKWRYKNKSPYDGVLSHLNYSDMSNKPEKLSQLVESRRGESA